MRWIVDGGGGQWALLKLLLSPPTVSIGLKKSQNSHENDTRTKEIGNHVGTGLLDEAGAGFLSF
jgi:hypothetical protein